MTNKQNTAFLISLSIIVAIHIITDVYRQHKYLEFREEMSVLHRKEYDQNKEVYLHKDIDRYKACNKNPGCENLYPEAAQAIKEAEDKVTREMENKSSYKE